MKFMTAGSRQKDESRVKDQGRFGASKTAAGKTEKPRQAVAFMIRTACAEVVCGANP
ncbi:hypothetical protein [Burkholderia sp. SRS-W-2-2016]|uniref:hypothetical protein n=1 Tax=Burkholderia sp. SRS-W-2-2016 TaxID=1926878 RepID=UPI0015BF8454|nr:hypothetical protein [Burkholderia sp. SRS-W-2-2016]